MDEERTRLIRVFIPYRNPYIVTSIRGIGFNKADVFISCTCSDFKYRFQYYATVNDLNSGTPETRPSDITNPDDSLGSGCKHILLVLNNTSWILRVARVINNYIKYMEKHYSKLYTEVMYPAIFGKDYVEPVDEPIEDEIPNTGSTKAIYAAAALAIAGAVALLIIKKKSDD